MYANALELREWEVMWTSSTIYCNTILNSLCTASDIIILRNAVLAIPQPTALEQNL